jgi:hypothetical protein
MSDKDFLAAVGITPWELDPATGRKVPPPPLEVNHTVELIDLAVKRFRLQCESALYALACATIIGVTFYMNR